MSKILNLPCFAPASVALVNSEPTQFFFEDVFKVVLVLLDHPAQRFLRKNVRHSQPVRCKILTNRFPTLSFRWFFILECSDNVPYLFAIFGFLFRPKHSETRVI